MCCFDFNAFNVYIILFFIYLLITLFNLYTFFIYLFDILFFFFVVSTFFRWFIKIASHTTRVNNCVQIFENTFFNNSLHDFNSFTLFFKRVFKRFLNDITTNVNNKSTKTLKKNKKKSSKAKNKFYVSKKSRVELYVTLYLFEFFLFVHIVTCRQQRNSLLFFFIFFFFFSSTWFILSLFVQFSLLNENNNVIKNILRDLTNDEFVNLNEYAFELKSNALKKKNKFVNLKKFVDEFEQKLYQSFFVN